MTTIMEPLERNRAELGVEAQKFKELLWNFCIENKLSDKQELELKKMMNGVLDLIDFLQRKE